MKGLILHTQEAEEFVKQLTQHISFSTCLLPAQDADVEAQDIACAILVLSPAFLKNEVEQDELFDEILAKSTDEDFSLIPILWQDCAWEDSMYSGLPFFPEDKMPIYSLSLDAQQTSVEQLAQQIRQRAERLQLKYENPKAFERQERKAVQKAQKGNFWLLAMKLSWRILPAKTKWIIRLAAGGGAAAIGYLVMG